jgi:hypothetical protein
MSDPLDELRRGYFDGGSPEIGDRLLRMLRTEGRVDEAIEVLNRRLQTPDIPPEQLSQLAVYALMLGLNELSIELFNKSTPHLSSDISRYACILDLSGAEFLTGRYGAGHAHLATLRTAYWQDLLRRQILEMDDYWWSSMPDRLLCDQSVAGKRVLIVHEEGGAGDLFHFIRYADQLVLEGAASVRAWVPGSVADLIATKSNLTVISGRPSDDEWDYFCQPLSLFTRFQPSRDTPHWPHPYLFSDKSHSLPSAVQAVLAQPAVRPRIGVVWRSATAVRHEPFRSMALATLAPLLANRSVDWLSLQVDGLSDEERGLLDRFGVTHLGDHLGSFQDTAQVLERLDLLISIDSAPIHLAGALGRPVWVLLSQAPDFRWCDDQHTTPWYPSARLFRQQRLGDWSDVVAGVAAAIDSLAAEWKPDLERASEPARAILQVSSKPFGRQVTLTISPQAKPAQTPNRVTPDATTDFARWTRQESLLPQWDGRAEFAAQFIPAGATVLDIGCGAMALERQLPRGCTYIPCDLHPRDPRTVLCNLNNGDFPLEAARSADIVTFLGVLEYLTDIPGLLAKLHAVKKDVLFTYHPMEFTGHLDRASLGWVNQLPMDAVISMIRQAGFTLENVERVDAIQFLFKLSGRPAVDAPAKRVAVLSYANLGNFGDRLGYHLLQSVLPPNVDIEHHFFEPWTDIDVKEIDLLVLGIGNSLFQPMLTDQLERLVAEAPRTIGIFGTQYRGLMPVARLKNVLSRVDTWFARYGEDINLYGEFARNTVHLGDWLIDAFPMATADIDELLTIGGEVWQDQPLDRTIQRIQRYKSVFSPRIHPLLCALTSATTMGYAEQRDMDGREPSGKFRSMLYDIFGRTYPENLLCEIDREKVRVYKSKVNEAVGDLRSALSIALGG